MKKFAVSVAAMLLCGFALSFSNVLAAPTSSNQVSISQFVQMLTPQTLTILLENHAAPYWNLSVEGAWYRYDTGELKVFEIVPEKHYRLTYDGGELVILLENF